MLGAAPPTAESPRGLEVRDIDIEWRADSVWLKSISDGRPIAIQAQDAIVHEPLPRLYAALPLARLEEPGRRFWRRVFRLVRIPGGRRGLEIELAPADLVRAANATVAPISRPR